MSKRHPIRLIGLIACLVVIALALLFLAAQPEPASANPHAAAPRRVNIPYFAGEVAWEQSAIFWFGQNKQGVPSQNYVDVRAAYTADSLRVRLTVVDYYLWYKDQPSPGDDLTQYDSAAIYLDTSHDRAAAPQSDDYMFLSEARFYPNWNDNRYHRQARGTGSGWNAAWSGAWSDYSSMQWACNPGPNSNTCGIDYGWTGIFSVPYTTVGLSGPPPEGTVWGFGVMLYDRDDNPPAGYIAPEHWPETFSANQPATWGELHFGDADFAPPSGVPRGVASIKAASASDNVVEDAWMGGGGLCASGHEGGTEINHGSDPDLFVGTETAPTHFPCFNKTYLRFALNAIPPGKMILSATLTLYHWGNAGAPGEAQPSWVHLFQIVDAWDEMTIHWNNAPFPQENIAATWIHPIVGSVPRPGNPYQWDATQAVVEAYASGQPVSLAIYGSDTDQHSSKYLTASETGETYASGRPRLDVLWGEAGATVVKSVNPVVRSAGQPVTYTMTIFGNGQPLTLTDNLPAQVSAPGPILVVGGGSAIYSAGLRRVTWNGTPSAGQNVTMTFPVTVTAAGPAAVSNTATLTGANVFAPSSTAIFIVDAYQVYLPLVRR